VLLDYRSDIGNSLFGVSIATTEHAVQ
jgi:hypothetical protein